MMTFFLRGGLNLITELWKDITGFEGYYEVSNLGNVRSIPRPSIKGGLLRLISHHKGYLCVNLCKDGVRSRKQVAVLVAQAFIPNPQNKPLVNHILGKEKHNNCVNNLEWTTISENTQHAYDTGLIVKMFGEKNHRSKLTDYQIEEIRTKLIEGDSRKSLAKSFKVSLALISLISSGHRSKRV